MIQIVRKSQEKKAEEKHAIEKMQKKQSRKSLSWSQGGGLERLLLFLLILMDNINHFYDIYASKIQLKACAVGLCKYL